MIEVKKDLRQRDLERYFAELRASGINPDQVSSPEYCGAVVRVAVKVGIITGLDAEYVGDLKPGKITWLSNEVQNLIVESMTVDPN